MGDYNDALMRNPDTQFQARAKAQNRSNVLQLKLIGQSHPTGLTNNILKLFEPRPPLEYKPPIEKRKGHPLTGMAQFVSQFAEPGDPEYTPPVKQAELPYEKRARIHKSRVEKGAERAAEELKAYDPNNNPNIYGDPYKTLFVARLSYESTESRIKREFEAYGPIKRVRLITDKMTNKPRGYAFVEYMHTRDMKTAYKQADGWKLDNRRVLVDVERGRTVPNWRPRRLGGGLGTTRVGGEEVNQKNSGRDTMNRTAFSGPWSFNGNLLALQEFNQESNNNQDNLALRSQGFGKIDMLSETERSLVNEEGTETRNKKNHVNVLMTGHENVIRETTGTVKMSIEPREIVEPVIVTGHVIVIMIMIMIDHDRGCDRGRDRDRTRDRERGRDKDRDFEIEDGPEGKHSRERESDYDRVDSKHGRHRDRKRDHDHTEVEEEYDHDRYDHPGRNNDMDVQGDEHDHDRYNQMDETNGRYDERKREKTQDMDVEYRRSERSLSRDYEH